jgi:hypothetical protein
VARNEREQSRGGSRCAGVLRPAICRTLVMTLLDMSFLPIELILFYEEKYPMRGQNRTVQTDTDVLSGIPLSILINLYNTMTYQKHEAKTWKGHLLFTEDRWKRYTSPLKIDDKGD